MTKKASSIESIVKRLSKSYHAEKKAAVGKAEGRKEFFEAITQGFDSDDLAKEIISVEAETEEDAVRAAGEANPLYVADVAQPDPDLEGVWEVIITENPEYKGYSVSVGGELWQRTAAVGSPTVDSERLEVEDPELFKEVTVVPEPVREMKPLDELDPVSLARLQKYVKTGKVSPRLPAPKQDKENE